MGSFLFHRKGEISMKVLLVKPHKAPQAIELDGSLASMQRIVGGTIQVLYSFQDAVALICNDDVKALGLPLNCALFDEVTGKMYNIIADAFLICAAPLDRNNFTRLTEEQLKASSTSTVRTERTIKMYENETFACNHCRYTFPLDEAIPCGEDMLCQTCADILT